MLYKEMKKQVLFLLKKLNENINLYFSSIIEEGINIHNTEQIKLSLDDIISAIDLYLKDTRKNYNNFNEISLKIREIKTLKDSNIDIKSIQDVIKIINEIIHMIKNDHQIIKKAV